MSDKRFGGKIAFVTGATGGIGLAVSKRLVNEGATVVGIGRSKDKLVEIEEDLGEKFLGIKGDVTDETSVKEAIEEIVKRFGRLDLAFNIAGGFKLGTVYEQSAEDWKFTIDLVLNGVFYSQKHAAKQMKEQGEGAIVNIGSLNSHVPLYSGAAYASAKAGLEMLSRNAAIELGPFGVRVNSILPGLVVTSLTEGMTENEELYEEFKERIPLNRAADPDDIAGPILYLASHDARYINGASLVVDGGWEHTAYPDLSKHDL